MEHLPSHMGEGISPLSTMMNNDLFSSTNFWWNPFFPMGISPLLFLLVSYFWWDVNGTSPLMHRQGDFSPFNNDE
jgi:hypothetical protein